ncbi:MAG: hypothetical protein HYS86_05410 [Candidatus Chisholmbacteria bacterium]|nr:hypothetical protein [Candidatus Chisholmbacteria bacterium]
MPEKDLSREEFLAYLVEAFGDDPDGMGTVVSARIAYDEAVELLGMLQRDWTRLPISTDNRVYWRIDVGGGKYRIFREDLGDEGERVRFTLYETGYEPVES